MSSWLSWPARALERLDGLGPFLMRLWLAQAFVMAGWTKLSAGWQAPEWFAGLRFPWIVAWLPVNLNWALAGLAEVALGLALLVGWQTRLAAAGLLFITYVAMYTVHLDLGWRGWNQIETDQGQGFMVPLMMAVMLGNLLTQGGGRYGLDAWRRPTPRT